MMKERKIEIFAFGKAENLHVESVAVYFGLSKGSSLDANYL